MATDETTSTGPDVVQLAGVVAREALRARRATERRDGAIRAWRAAGGSLREIGVAAGLSHSAVAKIVAR